jgi:endoglycosylceramidase
MTGRIQLHGATLLSILCAVLVTAGCRPTPPPPTTNPAATYRPFRAEGKWIRDAQGRVVFLRGVNYSNRSKRPPFTTWMRESHFDQMASFGCNAVRLLLSWEKVEPQKGVYDLAYLQHMEKVIRWCEQRDIWVILDMHQDIWSRAIGGNGAPAWATEDDLVEPDEDFGGPWALDYYTQECIYNFDRFWKSQSLQESFCKAWTTAVQHLGKSQNVIGFDLFNEPFGGNAAPHKFEKDLLKPFYEKVIAEIRKVDADRIVFIEPGIQTSIGGPSFLPKMSESNLAYIPHYYDITLQIGLPYYGSTQAAIGYSRVTAEAAFQEMPLVIGEWGAPLQNNQAVDYIRDQLKLQEDLLVSGTLLWGFEPPGGGFHPWNADGSERPALAHLDRPYPRRVSGIPTRFGFDIGQREFQLEWERDRSRQVTGPTVI